MKNDLRQKNIVLIGMPGAGKTTVGKILAERLHRRFIDTDVYLENKMQTDIATMFERGEAYFREQEFLATAEISIKKQIVIATGGGIVKNSQNIINLKKNGVIFFLKRTVEEILKSMHVEKRPLLKDNPREQLEKLYIERVSLYEQAADFEIDCLDDDIRASAEKIISIVIKGSAIDNK